MGRPVFIAGFAIVSADGMLANAQGVMPQELYFEADQVYFESALDRFDVMVHGRNSQESHRNSPSRRRVIATRRIVDVARDPANEKAVLWNPAAAPLVRALDLLGPPNATVAVIGGTDVFGLFLPRYDEFHLTRADGVHLPGGRPVFPGIPPHTPEDLLARNGLKERDRQVLDAAARLSLSTWVRPVA
jgi:dihydrofolate reductase